jgi:hypothetical protein
MAETFWLDYLTLLLWVSIVIRRFLSLLSRWAVDQLQELSLTCDTIFQLAVITWPSDGKHDHWRAWRFE